MAIDKGSGVNLSRRIRTIDRTHRIPKRNIRRALKTRPWYCCSNETEEGESVNKLKFQQKKKKADGDGSVAQCHSTKVKMLDQWKFEPNLNEESRINYQMTYESTERQTRTHQENGIWKWSRNNVMKQTEIRGISKRIGEGACRLSLSGETSETHGSRRCC